MMTWWPAYLRWRPDFGEIIDPRYYSLEWLDAMLWAGRAKLWANDAAAVATELRHYPTGACDLHFLCAAGNLQEIVDRLRPEAEDWARSIGCVGSIVESREGWRRTLREHGYRPYQTALRKDLN